MTKIFQFSPQPLLLLPSLAQLLLTGRNLRRQRLQMHGNFFASFILPAPGFGTLAAAGMKRCRIALENRCPVSGVAEGIGQSGEGFVAGAAGDPLRRQRRLLLARGRQQILPTSGQLLLEILAQAALPFEITAGALQAAQQSPARPFFGNNFGQILRHLAQLFRQGVNQGRRRFFGKAFHPDVAHPPAIEQPLKILVDRSGPGLALRNLACKLGLLGLGRRQRPGQGAFLPGQRLHPTSQIIKQTVESRRRLPRPRVVGGAAHRTRLPGPQAGTDIGDVFLAGDPRGFQPQSRFGQGLPPSVPFARSFLRQLPDAGALCSGLFQAGAEAGALLLQPQGFPADIE